jgi:hypothetical protein
MPRWLLAIGIVLLGFPFIPDARAVIIWVLHNPFDDWKALDAVRGDQRVLTFGKELDEFIHRLLPLKERDFHALFGKTVRNGSEEYALSVAGPRGVALSGIRSADPRMNKDHTDFHRVGDDGGIEVYYQTDGRTPAAIVLYFRVDRGFLRLKSAKELESRLGWERQHFSHMVRHFEARRRAVFEWEIDEKEEGKLYQGEDSPDLKVKLAAWMKAGERAGFRFVAEPETEHTRPEWKWYGPGNRLVWQARHDRGFKGAEALASEFIRFYPNGNPARKDGGWPEIYATWWYREDGTPVRCEGGSRQRGRWRPTDWTFYDKDGKAFRSEKDTNGDGIPDTVHDRPLAVKNSWAIHPELIPKECTLPELGGRRVPVRRIPFEGAILRPAPKGSMSAAPASLALLGLAYLGLVGYCWRRRKRTAA